MSEEQDGKIEHRLTTLEVKVQNLSDNLDNLKDNHIAHIQEEIGKIKDKQDSSKNWLIALLGGVVVDLAMRVFQLLS